jgi:hypothetical protein
MADDCTIVLDDAFRPQESAVAAIWREHLRGSESFTVGDLTGVAVFRRRVGSGAPPVT